MTMKQHEEFADALAAYALDALDPRERSSLEAHLATCAPCRKELLELRRAAMGVGLSAEAAPPPAALRDKIVARALSEPRVAGTAAPISIEERRFHQRRASLPPRWLAVAAALVLAAVSGMYAMWLRGEVLTLRDGLARADARSVELDRTLADVHRDTQTASRTLDVLSAPDLIRVDLKGQPDAPASSGRAFWSPSRGLLFSAEQLPALPNGRVYQLWLVTGTAPVSAGLLDVSASGTATTMTSMPANLPPAVAFAVTVEPAGGVPAPTGAKVLVGVASAH